MKKVIKKPKSGPPAAPSGEEENNISLLSRKSITKIALTKRGIHSAGTPPPLISQLSSLMKSLPKLPNPLRLIASILHFASFFLGQRFSRRYYKWYIILTLSK